LLCCLSGLQACAHPLPPLPPNASVGEARPASWPAMQIEPPGAMPQIQAMHFSSLDVKAGSDWDGEFVASSNTASIEVKTNLFEFSVPRPKVGYFAFHFHVIDVPAFFIRAYGLSVIARNTAGDRTEVKIPFRFSTRPDSQL
jgi:hypothetical protein